MMITKSLGEMICLRFGRNDMSCNNVSVSFHESCLTIISRIEPLYKI